MTTNPLDVSCPNCSALPGKRCIELRTRHRKRPLTRPEPHISRWWPTRPCPRCHALPGEQCRTPSGRIQRTPHTSRCALSREEQRRLEQQRSPPTTAAPPPRARAAASPPPDRPALVPLPAVPPGPRRTGVRAATQLTTEPPASDRDQPSAAAGRSDAPEAGIRAGHAPVAVDVAARAPGEQVATNTLRAYTSDWRQFERWTDERALNALPADPETCAAYLTDLAEQGLHVNTVRRRAHVIAQTHQRAGDGSPISDPRVQRALELAARAPRAPTGQKLPLLRAVLARVIDHIDTTSTSGLRDRALLLTGGALGLRRAELAAITVADLEPHPDGINVTLPPTAGRTPTTMLLARRQARNECPVAALDAWLERAAITQGPIARRVTRTGTISSPSPPNPSRSSSNDASPPPASTPASSPANPSAPDTPLKPSSTDSPKHKQATRRRPPNADQHGPKSGNRQRVYPRRSAARRRTRLPRHRVCPEHQVAIPARRRVKGRGVWVRRPSLAWTQRIVHPTCAPKRRPSPPSSTRGSADVRAATVTTQFWRRVEPRAISAAARELERQVVADHLRKQPPVLLKVGPASGRRHRRRANHGRSGASGERLRSRPRTSSVALGTPPARPPRRTGLRPR